MNRRFFMKALAASLGFFGFGKFIQAEDKVFRYSKFFRRADQATMDEFRDIIHLDEIGKAHKVPIIWADNDRAKAYLWYPFPEPKINLPILNLFRGDLFFSDKIYAYYHLTARTLYEEDMNQILEQVITKFYPKFKNAAGEYSLQSIINNYYPGGSLASIVERGDRAMRGDLMSAVQHGKQYDWVHEINGIRILRHEFNMIVALEGKP